MSYSHKKSFSCPVCGVSLESFVTVNIEDVNVSIECSEINHYSSTASLTDAPEAEPWEPYSPSLPRTAWFECFVKAANEEQTAWTDGKVMIFRHPLPKCFALNEDQKPRGLPKEFLTLPAGAREVRPHGVYKNMKVQVSDLEDRPLGFFVPRPAVDLAFWLCPEVRFFHTGTSLHHIFYMLDASDAVVMVSVSIKND